MPLNVTSSQETTQVTNPISGDYRIDTLLEDANFRWNSSSPLKTPATVTFSFMSAAPTYADASDTKGFTVFNDEQKAATRQILDQISKNFNITFHEVSDTATSYGQIRFGNNQQGATSAGYAYMPDPSSGDKAGDLYINNESPDNLSNVTPGTFAYSTLVHEIGHTLGLKHPGNYNAGEPALAGPGNYLAKTEDNLSNTVMSYVDVPQGQQPTFFQKNDFLALQYLYGGKDVNSGDNSYAYDDSAGQKLQIINDTGGNNTIDASSSTAPATIDLRAGNFSSIGKLADGTPAVNNVSIAYGTVIQNAVGTAQGDTITGNSANNTLTSGGGADTIDGGGGIDTVVIASAKADSSVSKTATGYIVSGPDGTDTLANVERIRFNDVKLALDVGGNAGTVAKILGAVFGSGAVANKAYEGIGLSYLDGGMSYADLMKLAIGARLGAGAGNADIVNLLYTNVVGSAPNEANLAYFKGLLDNGSYTVGSLGVLAADTTLNAANVNLVGLDSTGIEYA